MQARARQIADRVEGIAVIAMVPVAVGVFGLYSQLLNSFRGLAGSPAHPQPGKALESVHIGSHAGTARRAAVARWRREQSLRRTRAARPDLIDSATLSEDDWDYLKSLDSGSWPS